MKKRLLGTSLCIGMSVLFFTVPALAGGWVQIKGTIFVADSLDGVQAIYSEEPNSDSDPVFSCAAYVKKYYKEIYGVTVYNLMDEGPVLVAEGNYKMVLQTTPKKGDILFWPASKNKNRNHSAIVKKLSGNKITIIEQNYKTGSQTYVEREIPYPDASYEIYRLMDKSGKEASAGKPVSSAGETKPKEKPDFIIVHTPLESIENNQNETAFEAAQGGQSALAATEADYSPPEIGGQKERHEEITFTDVEEEDRYYTAIMECVSLGLLEGFEDGSFQADRPVNRFELAVILTKAAQGEAETAGSGFRDVAEDAWYYDSVVFAKKYMGWEERADGFYFRPLDAVTRQEVCQAIASFLEIQVDQMGVSILNSYQDKKEIAAHSQQAVAFCLEAGVISGFEDGTFRGGQAVSRGEMAEILSHVF